MWRKIVNIFGVLVVLGAVAAYICFAANLVRKHREKQKVEQLFISVNDDSELHRFTSSDYIRQQLQRSKIKIEEALVDSVDAVKVSECIAKNGFVRDVDVYVSYSGEAHIEITQHKPVMRLLCGGMNSYVIYEGDLFRSPQGAAYYTAVVTGSYKPLFPPTYEGSIADYYAMLQAKEDEKIVALNEEFAGLNKERRSCRDSISSLKKESQKKFFESDESHKFRRIGIGHSIKKLEARMKVLQGRRAQLEKRQQLIEKRKKKLQKSCDDFTNLINFVSQVEEHPFWSAEVVQFVADTTNRGDISLRLMPRSGDFVIEFGTLAESEQKLSKLKNFYDNGLSRMGWDRFKTVDVRYRKQVVCTK